MIYYPDDVKATMDSNDLGYVDTELCSLVMNGQLEPECSYEFFLDTETLKVTVSADTLKNGHLIVHKLILTKKEKT